MTNIKENYLEFLRLFNYIKTNDYYLIELLVLEVLKTI